MLFATGATFYVASAQGGPGREGGGWQAGARRRAYAACGTSPFTLVRNISRRKPG